MLVKKVLNFNCELGSHVAEKLKAILWLCLFSALIVVVLRFFTLTDLGYDLTIQIQAAQRLLAGEGLTTYAMGQGFLSEKTPATLTHFPAGYSLYTAILLWFGIPLYLVTKIFGSIFTILGWWGWGRFMLNCLAPAAQRGGIWFIAAMLLAGMLPLIATPAWDGTDIFLWAAVPWVLGWVAIAPTVSEKREYLLYALAGFVCGLCCLVRYASAIMAACIGMIVLLQAYPNWRKLLSRGFIFGLAALPPLLLQVYILATADGGKVAPGGIHGFGSFQRISENVFAGLQLLPTWNISLFFWLPASISGQLVGAAGSPIVAFLFVSLLALLPLLVYFQSKKHSFGESLQDIKILGSLLSLMTPAFLMVCMVLGSNNSYNYVGDKRYYVFLIPLTILLMVYLACSLENKTRFGKLISKCCSIYFLGFLAMSGIGVVFLFIPGLQGKVMREKLMRDSDIATFPSLGLAHKHSPMRHYVVETLKRKPGMHLLTNFEFLFWADASLNQSRIHRLALCQELSGKTVKGPQSILIAAIDEGDEKFYALGVTGYSESPCITEIPGLKLLQTFNETFYPATKIKVLEAEIPSGFQISF